MDAKTMILLICAVLTASTAFGQESFSRFGTFQNSRGSRFPTNWSEQFGAEELYDGDDSPRIPEPLVFDLVRPLGAKRGEAGIRTEFGGENRSERTQQLFNFSLYKHISDYSTLGLETNTAVDLDGASEFRLMPQVHCELRDHIMLQFGSGCLFPREATVPETAFRIIYSF